MKVATCISLVTIFDKQYHYIIDMRSDCYLDSSFREAMKTFCIWEIYTIFSKVHVHQGFGWS